MQVKLLEVRDRATFIPVFAMMTQASGASQEYLLGRAGFGRDRPVVIMGQLDPRQAHCDPYNWSDRTMKVAHQYIEDNWRALRDGDVIDVEFILGETPAPKRSERFGD